MICKFHIMFLTEVIFCSVYIFFALSFENRSVIIVLLIAWIVNVHAAHFTKVEYLLS
jgi:hypothetical protein